MWRKYWLLNIGWELYSPRLSWPSYWSLQVNKPFKCAINYELWTTNLSLTWDKGAVSKIVIWFQVSEDKNECVYGSNNKMKNSSQCTVWYSFLAFLFGWRREDVTPLQVNDYNRAGKEAYSPGSLAIDQTWDKSKSTPLQSPPHVLRLQTTPPSVYWHLPCQLTLKEQIRFWTCFQQTPKKLASLNKEYSTFVAFDQQHLILYKTPDQ